MADRPRLYLWTSGGLANRIRPLASMASWASLLGRDLRVLWEPDQECGLGLNAFPLPSGCAPVAARDLIHEGVTTALVKHSDFRRQEGSQPALVAHARSCWQVKPLTPSALTRISEAALAVVTHSPPLSPFEGYYRALRNLFPASLTGPLPAKTTRWIGLHIRLTDFAQQHGTDLHWWENALRSLETPLRRRGIEPETCMFFVASDDPRAWDLAASIWGERVLPPLVPPLAGASEAAYPSDGLGHQRAEQAVRRALRELVLLSQCDVRVGVFQSTFLNLAREIRAAWLGADVDNRSDPLDPRWHLLNVGAQPTSIVDVLQATRIIFRRMGLPEDILMPLPSQSALRHRYRRTVTRAKAELRWATKCL